MRYLILLTALVTSLAQAQDKPASNMDLLREKVRADKKLLVGTNMALTETEAKAFWPIYDAYQGDLGKLNDRTIKLVSDYAASYQAMSDAVAAKLLDEMIAIERDRSAMIASYRPKFAAVLPAMKVARYYQIENKIRAVVNYELADAIPIM